MSKKKDKAEVTISNQKLMMRVINEEKARNDAQIAAIMNGHAEILESNTDDSIAIGIIRKIQYDYASNELIKYALLYQIKQSKEYKTRGKTWDEFCNEIGEPRRTVDLKLRDISTLVDNFSANLATLAKVPFSKIRYLGNASLAGSASFEKDAIVIDGTRIPITPESKDDIEAFIDELKASHKREKEALEKEVTKAKKSEEKQVQAMTETFEIERDSMVKEIKDLKTKIPRNGTTEEREELMKKLETQAYLFIGCVDAFLNLHSEALLEDVPAQARIESRIHEVRSHLNRAWKEWVQEVNLSD